jgi:hypothetical protein
MYFYATVIVKTWALVMDGMRRQQRMHKYKGKLILA